MKVKLVALGVLLSTVFISGCDETDPLKLTQSYVHNETYDGVHHVIDVTSTDNEVVIESITFNRGNCPYKETKPVTLKFGQTQRYIVCDEDIIEANVKTNVGNYTYTW